MDTWKSFAYNSALIVFQFVEHLNHRIAYENNVVRSWVHGIVVENVEDQFLDQLVFGFLLQAF